MFVGLAPAFACPNAWYASKAAPTVTGVERLVPPHVSHALFPLRTVLSVRSPGEYEPSATTSTPVVPVEPGPRSDQTTTSLSGMFASFATESQPVPPNCVEAPTAMPLNGRGAVCVPYPGAPLPVEKIGVVCAPLRAACRKPASWL